MQLSILKTLFIVGTLAGVVFANDGSYHKHGYKHKDSGVIKRTILIDGCTGKPVSENTRGSHYENGGGSIPVVPNTPAPNTPRPNIPDVRPPNVPNVPNIPNIPNLPNLPNLPNVPDIPNLDQYADQIQELGRQLGLPV